MNQNIFYLPLAAGDYLADQQGVGRIGGLGENADAHAEFRHGHRIQVVGGGTDNLWFRADLLEPLADGFHPGMAAGHHQRLIHQTGQRDTVPLLPGQRMTHRDERHPGLPPDGEAFQMLGVIRGSDQRNIHQTPVKPFQHIVAAAVPETELHQRELLPETGNPTGHQKRGTALHHADGDGAGEPILHFLQLLPGFVRQLQHLVGPAQQKAAGFGQLQVPLAPEEQGNTQFLLQGLHLVAQRGLTHVQLFGGPGDIQLLGHHHKVFQTPQIHI